MKSGKEQRPVGGCVTFLLVAFLGLFFLGPILLSGPKRSELVKHNGPNQIYSSKAPKGAVFKSDSRSLNTTYGKLKINGESWSRGDESGASGVADIPLLLRPEVIGHEIGYDVLGLGAGRVVSKGEILQAVAEAQVSEIGRAHV